MNFKKKDESDGIIEKGLRECVYSFNRFEDLLCVCRRLSEIGYSEKSTVWRAGEKYYLILREPEENAYIPLCECSFIREYGKSENRKNTLLLLAETGECIARNNAFEILSRI